MNTVEHLCETRFFGVSQQTKLRQGDWWLGVLELGMKKSRSSLIARKKGHLKFT